MRRFLIRGLDRSARNEARIDPGASHRMRDAGTRGATRRDRAASSLYYLAWIPGHCTRSVFALAPNGSALPEFSRVCRQSVTSDYDM